MSSSVPPPFRPRQDPRTPAGLHRLVAAALSQLAPAPQRLWLLLVAVCLRNRSLAFAVRRNAGGRSATGWRQHLARLLERHPVPAWIAGLNGQLRERWRPLLGHRPVWLVGDETALPYWGQAAPEVRGGPPKLGTTRFFTFVTLCALWRGERIPLALAPWAREESLAQVLGRLLEDLLAAGVSIAGVMWDRGAANVELLGGVASLGLPYLVAAPRRGAKTGVGAICAGLEAERGWAARRPAPVTQPYTLRPERKRGLAPLTTWLVVDWESVKPRPRERRQRGPLRHQPAADQRWRAVAWFTDGGDWRGRGAAVRSFYRSRQTIESSYRLTHDCRGRTSSRDPRYRLLLFAISQLLQNLWTWLRRGQRSRRDDWPFIDFLEDLLEAVLAVRAAPGAMGGMGPPGAGG